MSLTQLCSSTTSRRPAGSLLGKIGSSHFRVPGLSSHAFAIAESGAKRPWDIGSGASSEMRNVSGISESGMSRTSFTSLWLRLLRSERYETSRSIPCRGRILAASRGSRIVPDGSGSSRRRARFWWTSARPRRNVRTSSRRSWAEACSSFLAWSPSAESNRGPPSTATRAAAGTGTDPGGQTQPKPGSVRIAQGF